MNKFSDVLTSLDNAEHIRQISLTDKAGQPVGLIENKPGSQGSIKVYHHLWKKYGSISVEAASDGLVLYAEHTVDAEKNPGKHPNIDRLFAVINNNQPLTVEIIR